MSVWCSVWAFNSNDIMDCCKTCTKAFVFLALREVVYVFDDYCTYMNRKRVPIEGTPKIWTVWLMNLNKTFCGASGSSWRPASNFSMNYKTVVFEKDLVLSLYFFPTLCKDHEMKEMLAVGAKECMVSPESFSFTDKHTAASVNKIHGERVRHIW